MKGSLLEMKIRQKQNGNNEKHPPQELQKPRKSEEPKT